MTRPKVAYLISQYPAISHSFILREVRRLRALGLHIKTASINACDRSIEDLDDDERDEAEETFYIKKQGAFAAFSALVKRLITSPFKFINAIYTAFSLAGWDIFRAFKHLAYLGEAAILGNWMDKQKISHLHVHFANPASTVSLITSKLFPISFSMTVHGPDEFYDVTLNNLPKKVREAEFVICISDYTQSQLMRISSVSEWDKFNVLPLGVDPDIFSPRFEPVRSGPCQILCVGRLVPSKGQHILLAAFAKLVNEGKNARLHLIGGGPDKLSLEKKIQELGIHKLVSINGALNPRQVVEAYQYADVFALSSFAEGLPIVLMEAMSMEIPCVATCINGIPELVRHNVEGLLVAPSNVEQLSQILELLIEDIELRKRLGKAGRQRILEKFNLEENVIRLYQLFKTHIPH